MRDCARRATAAPCGGRTAAALRVRDSHVDALLVASGFSCKLRSHRPRTNVFNIERHERAAAVKPPGVHTFSCVHARRHILSRAEIGGLYGESHLRLTIRLIHSLFLGRGLVGHFPDMHLYILCVLAGFV